MDNFKSIALRKGMEPASFARAIVQAWMAGYALSAAPSPAAGAPDTPGLPGDQATRSTKGGSTL